MMSRIGSVKERAHTCLHVSCLATPRQSWGFGFERLCLSGAATLRLWVEATSSQENQVVQNAYLPWPKPVPQWRVTWRPECSNCQYSLVVSDHTALAGTRCSRTISPRLLKVLGCNMIQLAAILCHLKIQFWSIKGVRPWCCQLDTKQKLIVFV